MNNISTTIKLGVIAFGLAALLALVAVSAIHPQRPKEILVVSPGSTASSSLSAPITAPEAASVATPIPKPVVVAKAAHKAPTTTTSITAPPARSAALESRIPGPTDDLAQYGGVYCPDHCIDVADTPGD